MKAGEVNNLEHYKWLWDRTSDPENLDKIVDGIAATGDVEALKWVWYRTPSPGRKKRLIEALTAAQQRGKGDRLPKRSISVQKKGKAEMRDSFKYDVFISHASEDKDSFVRELATKLTSKGLVVWYDEFTLSLGDSLRRSIDRGLSMSRYGVVVLSENFFKKEWPEKELDGLVAREDGLDKVILPVWHRVTKKQVQSFSPILSDRIAVSSSKGSDYVVNEIIKVVRKSSN